MGSSESAPTNSGRTSTNPYGARGQDVLGNRFWRSRTGATKEDPEAEREEFNEEFLDGTL